VVTDLHDLTLVLELSEPENVRGVEHIRQVRGCAVRDVFLGCSDQNSEELVCNTEDRITR